MAKTPFSFWWRAQTASEKREFANKVNCSLQYLRNISSGSRLPSCKLAVAMKKSANGMLDNVDLRPQWLIEKLSTNHKIDSSRLN